MGIKLTVPMVYQAKSDTCWYAGCCMVKYYHVAGPRFGIPARWKANHAISATQWGELAQNDGLTVVDLKGAQSQSEDQLTQTLRRFGPLWAAGNWDGVGHVIVITGVENGKIFANDPSPSVGRREETIAWFNQKLYYGWKPLMHGKE